MKKTHPLGGVGGVSLTVSRPPTRGGKGGSAKARGTYLKVNPGWVPMKIR